MFYEEDNSEFQLPIQNTAASAVVFEAPKAPVSSVAEAAKVEPAQKPAQITNSYTQTDKISDQALFDELNAVSEEVLACRNQILSKIC
ncbi:MAG: hypothetical protein MJ154_01805 [Candidatus Saccharibacteria bacterium]|nr:hypothetical protein [Candidatus Saccharibacteria bacterium]